MHPNNAPTELRSRLDIVQEIGKPLKLVGAVPLPTSRPQSPSQLPTVFLTVWACGFLINCFNWWRAWRRLRVALHAATPVFLNLPIRAMSSSLCLEPGIFGIRNPVLLLPNGITARLRPAEFEAIIAHEMCHVRRRDNLAAAIHMVVEALFWFHPMVWWIRTCLMEERELACDEAVLGMTADPQEYAEGILKICKYYLESPLICASGITRSNLKKRINEIMINREKQRLSFSKKLLLAVGVLLAVAVPLIVTGFKPIIVRAQAPGDSSPLKFEVAAIRPHVSAAVRDMGNGKIVRAGTSMTFSGPRATIQNVTLMGLIEFAYEVSVAGVSGGPQWADSARFDVTAKGEGTRIYTKDEFRRMFRTVLKERYKLKFHLDTKTASGYSLVVAKGGPKLARSAPEAESSMRLGGGGTTSQMTVSKWTMAQLASQLSLLTGHVEGGSMVPTPIVDSTGIVGSYDFVLKWADDQNHDPDTTFPSLFSALQEQLGLKLERQKTSVQVLVIDNAEYPSKN